MEEREIIYDKNAGIITIESDTVYGNTVFIYSQKVSSDGIAEINCTVELPSNPEEALVVASNIPIIQDHVQQMADSSQSQIRILTHEDDFAPFSALTNAGYTALLNRYDTVRGQAVLSKLILPNGILNN